VAQPQHTYGWLKLLLLTDFITLIIFMTLRNAMSRTQYFWHCGITDASKPDHFLFGGKWHCGTSKTYPIREKADRFDARSRQAQRSRWWRFLIG